MILIARKLVEALDVARAREPAVGLEGHVHAVRADVREQLLRLAGVVGDELLPRAHLDLASSRAAHDKDVDVVLVLVALENAGRKAREKSSLEHEDALRLLALHRHSRLLPSGARVGLPVRRSSRTITAIQQSKLSHKKEI
jgi:hypothetical protein